MSRKLLSGWIYLVLLLPVAIGAAVGAATEAVSGSGFVGAGACVGCHAEQVDSWPGSHHDLAMQEASEETVLGDFSGVTLDHFGVTSTFSRQGGRYVSSGAIAGPIVQLDMRTFYLRDLTMIGCTAWDEPVFPNLISYIERGEIRPLVAKTFPLEQIVEAQREFTKKKHVGKLVLIPLPLEESQLSMFLS